MNVRPLSLVNRSHLPSSSVRTFLLFPRLSVTVNVIRLVLPRLAPSARPGVLICGGISSVTKRKAPKSRKRHDAHPFCHSTFWTSFLLPLYHCITVRCCSWIVKERLGWIRTRKGSCKGIAEEPM